MLLLRASIFNLVWVWGLSIILFLDPFIIPKQVPLLQTVYFVQVLSCWFEVKLNNLKRIISSVVLLHISVSLIAEQYVNKMLLIWPLNLSPEDTWLVYLGNCKFNLSVKVSVLVWALFSWPVPSPSMLILNKLNFGQRLECFNIL